MASKKRPAMPDAVRVGAMTYSITTDPMSHLGFEDEMSTRLDGISKHGTLKIGIHPDLADDVKKQTLVHELIHCVFSSVSGFKPEDEEQVCRSLEGGLLGVLRDNPDLVAWLQSR